MSSLTPYEQVMIAIVDQFQVHRSALQWETQLAALGADELDRFELACALQAACRVEIGEQDMAAVTTVGDLVELVEGKSEAEAA